MTHLRRRIAEDMQVCNLSPCTQDTYIRQVSLFARHFGKSPELLGPEQIREHQVRLATGKRLAPGSIAVAVAALRFLYGVTLQKDWNIPEVLPTPKQPVKLPVVPGPEEVVSSLGAVPILRTHVVLTTCNAAGLRISEAVSLRPADIDSRRMMVRVEEGKGGKERHALPAHAGDSARLLAARAARRRVAVPRHDPRPPPLPGHSRTGLPEGPRRGRPRQAHHATFAEAQCRVADDSVLLAKDGRDSCLEGRRTRNSHRAFRNAGTSSSGRYRSGGTSPGVVRAIAFSLSERSAFRWM